MMKHTTSRMMFAYWDALRAERAAPDRRDVQPGGMRHILADAFVLAREDSAIRFRLAGSRIGALFGRDLRGLPFRSLWPSEADREADALVDVVAVNTLGVVAGLVGTNQHGMRLPLEILLLPLRHRGRADTRLVGALSPASLPSWAGLVPLVRLETTSVRIVQPEATAPRSAEFVHRPEAESLRGMFVVHDGGRA